MHVTYQSFVCYAACTCTPPLPSSQVNMADDKSDQNIYKFERQVHFTDYMYSVWRKKNCKNSSFVDCQSRQMGSDWLISLTPLEFYWSSAPSCDITCLPLFPSRRSESRLRKLNISCGSKWQIWSIRRGFAHHWQCYPVSAPL